MKTVWKFPLGPGAAPSVSVGMPAGAEILRLGKTEAGRTLADRATRQPCLWALVDTAAPLETRRFAIVGTGHELPAHTQYLGTYESDGGRWVWHVFEFLGEPLPDALPGMTPEQERAYRTLVSDGWVLHHRPAGKSLWEKPDDEPLTHEQIIALGELAEIALANVA